ncbi:unnamed protein product [Effrenium voratum]|nr:unnamed protein product [Effrenium voratum]
MSLDFHGALGLDRRCGYQGLRLHYSSNVRLGLDRFSTRFWQAEVNMTEEGRVAVLNLLLGSRAVAVLGSFHSAWMKLQPAFMMAYHWKAVLVIGLAGQDYQNFGSLDNPRQQLLRPGEVWARMLAQHILPMELIEALPKLLVACSDIYARVRHRLLVLLCLAAANPAAFAEHSGDIRPGGIS